MPHVHAQQEDHAIMQLYSHLLDAHNHTKLTPAPSCTPVPSKWNVPKSNKAPKDIPVSTLHIKKPSYLKLQKTVLPSPHIPISPHTSQVTLDRIMKLRQDLSEHCTRTLLFHQVWPETTDPSQIAKLTLYRTPPVPPPSTSSKMSLGTLPTPPHSNLSNSLTSFSKSHHLYKRFHLQQSIIMIQQIK